MERLRRVAEDVVFESGRNVQPVPLTARGAIALPVGAWAIDSDTRIAMVVGNHEGRAGPAVAEDVSDFVDGAAVETGPAPRLRAEAAFEEFLAMGLEKSHSSSSSSDTRSRYAPSATRT